MDAVIEYAKVPVTIQSYSKSQSYEKSMGTPSDSKDTRCNRSRAAAAATSSTSEEFFVLNTNDDKTFTLGGKIYPLKALVTEEFYLGKMSKFFWGTRREKIWSYHSSRMRRTRTGRRIKTTSETLRLLQSRLIPSHRRRIIQKQCLVTLNSRSQLPHLKFKLTPPQIHSPFQRIPLLKASSLPQVIGYKCRRPQLQSTQTPLPL